MFANLVLVAVGGAAGAVARYLMVESLTQFLATSWATFTVNLVGCGIAGALVGYLFDTAWFQSNGRLLLLIGFLGAFTTFSAFSVDFFQLISAHKWTQAIMYVTLSVGGSLLAFWLAYRLVNLNA